MTHFVLNKSSNFPQIINTGALEKEEEEKEGKEVARKKKNRMTAPGSPALPLHRFVSVCMTGVTQCPVFQMH